MTNTPTEETIRQQIRKYVGTLPRYRLFPNPVGTGYLSSAAKFTTTENGTVAILTNPRRISYGLCVGSGDLIGWRSRVITQADVGTTIAQFVTLEVKTDTGRPSPEQVNFLRVVTDFGGVAGIVRNVDDVRTLLGEVA